MLVTFQSKAAPAVTMLRDQAEYLLGLIGRRLDSQGVITHGDLPGSIKRLECELSEAERTERRMDRAHHVESSDRMPANELSQRAWPLLQLMHESERQQADIIWGL